MLIKTSLRNREVLIDFLVNETGEKPKYLGAPGFKYEIGPYTVTRNGDLQLEGSADQEFLDHMRDSGFMEKGEEEGIKVPFLTDDVTARMNLISLMASKLPLINKAIGEKNAFIIRKGFQKKLKAMNPGDLDAFRSALVSLDASRNLRGFVFYDDKVIFTGFPKNVSELEMEAYKQLAECLVRKSEKMRWVKQTATQEVENEKFTFRCFLVQIGMIGDEYDTTRKLLIANLDGDGCAYKNPEKLEAFYEKRKILGAKRKEDECDFFIL